MRQLEAPNRLFRQRTIEAVDRAGRVGPIAQSALELSYARRAAVDGIARATSEQTAR